MRYKRWLAYIWRLLKVLVVVLIGCSWRLRWLFDWHISFDNMKWFGHLCFLRHLWRIIGHFVLIVLRRFRFRYDGLSFLWCRWRLELNRLIVLIERTIGWKWLKWFLLRRRRWCHRWRITFVLVAWRMLSFCFRFCCITSRIIVASITATTATRTMVALGVTHQIRFQFERFSANRTSKWSILWVCCDMITIQMTIGKFSLAHLASVQFFLGMLIIDMLPQRMDCCIRTTALFTHKARCYILVYLHVPRQIRPSIKGLFTMITFMRFCCVMEDQKKNRKCWKMTITMNRFWNAFKC